MSVVTSPTTELDYASKQEGRSRREDVAELEAYTAGSRLCLELGDGDTCYSPRECILQRPQQAEDESSRLAVPSV